MTNEQRKKLGMQHHFTIATNNLKYLGVIPNEQVKDMYDKIFKSLKKKFKDIRRWNDLPCSWISRINSLKMKILPIVIYRFNAMTITIPTQLFIDHVITILHMEKNDS